MSDSRPLKVCLDVSALGVYEQSTAPRAGVARLVEELARHLLKSEVCELALSGWGPYQRKTEEYLARNGEWPELLHPQAIRYIPGTVRRIAVKAVRLLGCPFGLRTDNRSGRSDTIWHGVRRRHPYLVDRSRLEQADLYHSTHLPVPAEINSSRWLVPVLTVCDVVTLLYPEFYSAGTIALHQAIHGSITDRTWIIAISEATKRDVCEYLSVEPRRVHVAPLAASPVMFHHVSASDERSAVLAGYGVPPVPYVLSVCTIEPRKNLGLLVRAYSDLIAQQKINDFNLVLVGADGWLLDHALPERDLIRELGKRVILTGRVSDEHLSAFYSGAEMFVYVPHYEGFGLPPLEAMMCGTPVICSNTSSLPEVVGEAAVLVHPKDGAALSQAMMGLHASKDRRNDLSVKGAERAKLFSWDRCATETVRTYQDAVWHR